MKDLRTLIQDLINEAIAAKGQKSYSIKFNAANKHYMLYRKQLDDSDPYNPVEREVSIADLGADPEKAEKQAFKITKRTLKVPGNISEPKTDINKAISPLGKYKGEHFEDIPVMYLFELLFFGPKTLIKVKEDPFYYQVYHYLTTVKHDEFSEFINKYLDGFPKSKLIEWYSDLKRYGSYAVFFDLLFPKLKYRLEKEHNVQFDSDGNIIIPPGLAYNVGEDYTETVRFGGSKPSKFERGEFLWYFIDDESNLIYAVQNKDFRSNQVKYTIKFRVISIKPMQDKPYSLIKVKLWSVQ